MDTVTIASLAGNAALAVLWGWTALKHGAARGVSKELAAENETLVVKLRGLRAELDPLKAAEAQRKRQRAAALAKAKQVNAARAAAKAAPATQAKKARRKA